MQRVYDALVSAGQDQNEMRFVSEPDGAHSEWFWGREYPDAYKWLFANSVFATQMEESQYWKIYPDPAGDYLTVLTAPDDLPYSIYKLNGAPVMSGKLHHRHLNIAELETGGYYLQVANRAGVNIFVSSFVKK